ncbi:MAG TPA: hypothetical protein VIU82_10425 [Bosea sp. (in: a-proteobacteria)]
MSNLASPQIAVGAARARATRSERPRRWDRVPDLSGAPDELLLAPAEVAALSGIAEVTWYVWRKQGRGPSWLLVEGMPRLRLGDYRQWLDARGRA